MPVNVNDSLAIIPAMLNFALLGPVPPGGSGKLPGIVLLIVGVAGLLSLPSQIKRMRSSAQPRFLPYVVAAMDVAFLVVGALLSRSG
jgi:hypothetical protein